MKITLPFRRLADQRGFGHVELVLIIAFVAVFAFVGVRVISASHAVTVAFATQTQCSQLGRTWNATATSGVNPCNKVCASGQGSYVVAPIYDYCSGALTLPTVLNQTSCANRYRAWVLGVGCARLASQKSGVNTLQCTTAGKQYYYVASPYDYCAAPPVATTPVSTTPTPSPTPSPAPSPAPAPTSTTHTNTTVTDATNCTLRGRNWSGTTCGTTCTSGSLVTSGTYAFCSTSVSTSISASGCAALNRKWLTDGCARRADQQKLVGAPQCTSTSLTYFVESPYDACASNANTITTVTTAGAAAIKKAPVSSAGNPSSGSTSGGSSSILTKTYCENTLHRIWNGSNCDKKCATGYPSYNVTSTYDYCSKSAPITSQCPGGKAEYKGGGTTLVCVYPPTHFKTQATCQSAGYKWTFNIVPILHIEINHRCTNQPTTPPPATSQRNKSI